MRRFASCIAAGLFVITLLPRAGAAPDEAVRLDYELYAGGLNAMNATMLLSMGGNGYDIRLQARTAGVTARVFPFVMEAGSRGEQEKEAFVPEEYRNANRSGERDVRWVRIRYNGGAPEITGDPPRDEDDIEVPSEERRGKLDPVTAIYSLLISAGEACGGKAEVFDGRRRYNLVAEDRGEGEIWPSRYNIYDGPAHVCDLRLEPVQQFANGSDFGERYPDTVRVYLAEIVPGGPALPVRLETETLLGPVRAHLTGLSRGEAAELPEAGLLP